MSTVRSEEVNEPTSDIGHEGYVCLSAVTTCCVWADRVIHSRVDCSLLRDRRVMFVRELPHPNGGTYPHAFVLCGECPVEKA